ncbi:MAG: 3-hydroxyanthranilate 3,4-dioxygenase, partial [Rhodospirillaceae bacterium]|nr:3-hydroxyanthranilate 3,4-dioxygenase [Rhodospirillaceae bacterium]
MADLSAFNLTEWIEKNRDQLKPPVGNARVLPEGDFIVMAIGGPNLRTDYHDDPGEEIFYQLEGDMILRVMEEGGPRDISIKAGDIFLLPANIRHSPQRPADSVGLVVERLRKSGELDGFEWFCE